MLTGNVQVGEGVGSTSLGVGGAFSNGQIAPVATTSINGPTVGGVATPVATTGAIFNGQGALPGGAQGFAGVGVNSDHLSHNVGSVSNIGSSLLGRKRRSAVAYSPVVYRVVYV